MELNREQLQQIKESQSAVLAEPSFIPFEQMVSNLFKTDGMNNKAAPLLHAFLGIATEIWELSPGNIISRQNLIEEYGDLLFYIEAARQSLLNLIKPIDPICSVVMYLEDLPNTIETLPIISHSNLEKEIGNALDLVKKIWVYNKDPLPLSNRLYEHLRNILGILKFRFELEGIDAGEVIRHNQEKLGKRYPEGVYRDQDAQARADKENNG